MDIILIDEKNIDKEHVCCAISETKNDDRATKKKNWMKENFAKGLTFRRLDARGKVFIEYIPAENAWAPITAPQFMYINCFWVSGSFKGKGYGIKLLEECIEDSKTKGKSGLVVLSASKKMPFLSDGKYLKEKGFKVCDTLNPNYELLYFAFDEKAEMPKFNPSVKNPQVENEGYVLYFANQCPHAEMYSEKIAEMAKQAGISFKLVKFENAKEAQNAPAPFTTYSLFEDGKFVTNEILSESKFAKMLEARLK